MNAVGALATLATGAALTGMAGGNLDFGFWIFDLEEEDF
jgi:hypothetical protein